MLDQDKVEYSHLLDDVWIFQGEVTCSSLLGVKGLNDKTLTRKF